MTFMRGMLLNRVLKQGLDIIMLIAMLGVVFFISKRFLRKRIYCSSNSDILILISPTTTDIELVVETEDANNTSFTDFIICISRSPNLRLFSITIFSTGILDCCRSSNLARFADKRDAVLDATIDLPSLEPNSLSV